MAQDTDVKGGFCLRHTAVKTLHRLVDHPHLLVQMRYQFLDAFRLEDNQACGQLQGLLSLRAGPNVAIEVSPRQRHNQRSHWVEPPKALNSRKTSASV